MPSQAENVPARLQRNPGQQACVGEHCWPAPGQVAPGWQVPLAWPGGTAQESPEQQSAVAVQAWPWGWQESGAWHVPATQKVEQHSGPVPQVLPFCLQPVPPSLPPSGEPPSAPPSGEPPSGGEAGLRQTVGPSSEGSQAPSQQVSPAPHVVPSGTQAGRVHRRTPETSGTQGFPSQHWSLNWQTWPAAMQQGARPV